MKNAPGRRGGGTREGSLLDRSAKLRAATLLRKAEKLTYVAWIEVLGLSHDERMKRVQEQKCHHAYYADLGEVAAPVEVDAPDSLGTEG